MRQATDRGQLVLVAAAVVAVALAPVVLAYLQLGYHPDVTASEDFDEPARNAERVLERAVHEAGANATGEFPWVAATAAVNQTRADLDPVLANLTTARLASGTAYRITYDEETAAAWRRQACPSGPDRRFGPCDDDRGVVVQERDDTTHVLAVAFDVTVTTDRGTTNLTVVVRTVGGTAADGDEP